MILPAKERQHKRPKQETKVSKAVRRWLEQTLPELSQQTTTGPTWDLETLVSQAPKRWVVYEPMVLLPTGSFGLDSITVPFSSRWRELLDTVSSEQQEDLWRGILRELSPRKASGGDDAQQLTHLAVNEAIPLHVDPTQQTTENVLRSPTGLHALHGDFGPTQLDHEGDPTEADFAQAFWVTTRQNGIVQTWAPRWSMFSRGNIKEKARLLAWPDEAESSSFSSSSLSSSWALDLYAGIGYFVFSYAKRGLRVLCWELNPWSAEALRRGAALNGWKVQVISSRDNYDYDYEHDHGDNNIVLFVQDNQNAAQRLQTMRSAAAAASLDPLRFSHVNCGLLPTSCDTWRTAWEAVVRGHDASPAWLHLHENVGVADTDRRRHEIQVLFDEWAAEEKEKEKEEEEEKGAIKGTSALSLQARVEHVELVKTFAPGVWHCVFDVAIRWV